jgi:hypothetical protein
MYGFRGVRPTSWFFRIEFESGTILWQELVNSDNYTLNREDILCVQSHGCQKSHTSRCIQGNTSLKAKDFHQCGTYHHGQIT